MTMRIAQSLNMLIYYKLSDKFEKDVQDVHSASIFDIH